MARPAFPLNILFVNLSGVIFTVASPEREPLGGTESCVSYLARQLAHEGHRVALIARLPENTPPHVMGVAHYPLGVIQDKNFFDAQKFDVIVTCNAPVANPHLKALSPDSLNLLWNHMAPDQPGIQAIADPEFLNAADGIVYVSQWQREATEKHFGITKRACVIGNGLTPAFAGMFASPQGLLAAKQNRAAYTSTPHRGLRLLLKVMEAMPARTKLDIFSSMKVYQMPDDEYAELYDAARSNPDIAYRGSVPQSELAQSLKTSAFLAYPCIYPETYCLAALEAMAAGMKVIATDLAALPTTTMGYADLLPLGGSETAFIKAFAACMEKNIAEFQTHPETWAEKMFEQSQRVNRECSWALRARDWGKLCQSKHTLSAKLL